MALLTTLLLGLPFFAFGLTQNGGRVARGLSAVGAWTLLWILAVALVALVHRSRQDARRGAPWPRARLALLLAAVALAWIAFTAPFVASGGAGDFGMDHGPAILLAVLVAPFGLLLVPAGPALFRLARTTPPGGLRLPVQRALLSGLAPLLLPAVVLACLRALPVAPPYAGRIAADGLAGILFLQLETVAWFGALVVAWGLDRSDGSGDRLLHRIRARAAAAGGAHRGRGGPGRPAGGPAGGAARRGVGLRADLGRPSAARGARCPRAARSCGGHDRAALSGRPRRAGVGGRRGRPSPAR